MSRPDDSVSAVSAGFFNPMLGGGAAVTVFGGGGGGLGPGAFDLEPVSTQESAYKVIHQFLYFGSRLLTGSSETSVDIGGERGASCTIYAKVTHATEGAPELTVVKKDGQPSSDDNTMSVTYVALWYYDAESEQLVDLRNVPGVPAYVSPDDVSISLVNENGQSESESESASGHTIQLKDFNNSDSDSPEGLVQRLKADPSTGLISSDVKNIMLVARRDGKLVYIPLSADGTDPADDEDPDLVDISPLPRKTWVLGGTQRTVNASDDLSIGSKTFYAGYGIELTINGNSIIISRKTEDDEIPIAGYTGTRTILGNVRYLEKSHALQKRMIAETWENGILKSQSLGAWQTYHTAVEETVNEE